MADIIQGLESVLGEVDETQDLQSIRVSFLRCPSCIVRRLRPGITRPESTSGKLYVYFSYCSAKILKKKKRTKKLSHLLARVLANGQLSKYSILYQSHVVRAMLGMWIPAEMGIDVLVAHMDWRCTAGMLGSHEAFRLRYHIVNSQRAITTKMRRTYHPRTSHCA